MQLVGFVRHGKTEWNARRIIQGQLDIDLNEEGRQQAEALATRLAGDRWDIIVSSDLSRARTTAEIIAAASGAKVAGLDRRLRERSFGRMEGMHADERDAATGEHLLALQQSVETDEALIARGLAAFADITEQYAGKRILIVSHGVMLRHMLKTLLDNKKGPRLDNTSLSIIRQRDTAWEELLYNCTAHLH